MLYFFLKHIFLPISPCIRLCTITPKVYVKNTKKQPEMRRNTAIRYLSAECSIFLRPPYVPFLNIILSQQTPNGTPFVPLNLHYYIPGYFI